MDSYIECFVVVRVFLNVLVQASVEYLFCSGRVLCQALWGHKTELGMNLHLGTLKQK